MSARDPEAPAVPRAPAPSGSSDTRAPRCAECGVPATGTRYTGGFVRTPCCWSHGGETYEVLRSRPEVSP